MKGNENNISLEQNNKHYYNYISWQLITQFTGQANILTIPRVLIDLVGDINTALLLNQLLYWTPRASQNNGWIAKTYKDWQDEISLSKYQVMKAAEKLKNANFLQTKVAKFKGNPTVWYKINGTFLLSIVKFLNERKLSNLTNHIHRLHTETTNNINIYENQKIENELIKITVERDERGAVVKRKVYPYSSGGYPMDIGEVSDEHRIGVSDEHRSRDIENIVLENSIYIETKNEQLSKEMIPSDSLCYDGSTGQKKKAKSSPLTEIPPDFTVSDQVRAWAEKNGYTDLEEHLEAFKMLAISKGYKYKDWDAAFKRAIREDWGKVRELKQKARNEYL